METPFVILGCQFAVMLEFPSPAQGIVGVLAGVLFLCLVIYWTTVGKVWRPRSTTMINRVDSPIEYWFGLAVYYFIALAIIVYFIDGLLQDFRISPSI